MPDEIVRFYSGGVDHRGRTVEALNAIKQEMACMLEPRRPVGPYLDCASAIASRMAVAKDLLRRHDSGVAERVGYGSAITFSTAFSRHVGQPPSRYARDG